MLRSSVCFLLTMTEPASCQKNQETSFWQLVLSHVAPIKTHPRCAGIISHGILLRLLVQSKTQGNSSDINA